MQKIRICILLLICALFVSCAEKQVDAELIYLDEHQKETLYSVKKTDNPEDVKKLFEILDQTKINTSFNGVAMKLNTNVEGFIKIQGTELRTVDLRYTMDVSAKSNLRKYRFDGNILIDGYTKTNSDSLSFDTKYKLKGDIQNDDEFLYLIGNLDNGNTHLSIKNKLDITYITENYKAMIISFIDVLKYYSLSSVLPNINEMIDCFKIIIVDTTKDSFTLRLTIPTEKIWEELDLKENIEMDVKISCKHLLPTEITCSADQLITGLLENEYVEKYLSSEVTVEKSKFSATLALEYGYYTIQELTKEQKEEYKIYSIQG